MTPKSRSTPVTVVFGMAADPVAAVVDDLLARTDRLVALSYRTTPAGGLLRTVRDSDGRHEARERPTGCVAARMLADGIGELRRLARSGRYDGLVLQLGGSWDAALVLAGLTEDDPLGDDARVDTVVTVVDAVRLPADLDSTDSLADRGLGLTGADRRTLAPLVARQVEAADTVLLDGAAGPHPAAVLVDRLAPDALLLALGTPGDLRLAAVLGTGRFDRDRLDPFADTGPLDRGRAGTVDRDGLGTARFEARRPLHPARLRAVLPDLVDEALRGRGRLWLATRPDCVVRFDLAGGTVAMEPIARWLDAPDGGPGHRPGRQQRWTAERVWDPYYGDRAQHLAFTGPGLDADLVRVRQRSCLLTDLELAGGPDEWRDLPDPITAGAGRPGRAAP